MFSVKTFQFCCSKFFFQNAVNLYYYGIPESHQKHALANLQNKKERKTDYTIVRTDSINLANKIPQQQFYKLVSTTN